MRVLLIAVALLAAGLVTGSLVVIGALESYLVDRIDTQLRPAAYVYARLSSDGPFAGRQVDGVPGAGRLLGDPYVAYLDSKGAIESERLSRRRPERSAPRLPQLDSVAVAAVGKDPFTVPDRDGSGRWRVIALPRADELLDGGPRPDAGEASVVVASSLDEADATIARLGAVCLVTGLSLLAILTAAGWFAIRAGLRPMRVIEETSAAIARGDLSRRVPHLAAPGTEIGRMAGALNSMLDHNQAAFAARADSEARMRRFVADAGHELRTPLAGIRGFTKLYRMGAMPARGQVDHAMARIEKESERMTRLVEDLLLLARLDERQHPPADPNAPYGGLPLDCAPTDLRTLAVDALHDIQALDPTRPVELTGPDGGQPAAAPAMADEARLRQVVTNLVGNAIAHTPTGTAIRIGVGTLAGAAILEVADHGPGIPADQAARVFDRFYRADASRSRVDGAGAGLGLSIVQSLVEAQGGWVELHTSPGQGATFRVLLPVAVADVVDHD